MYFFFLWYALCLTVRWIGLFFSHYFGILTKIWRGRCFSHFFDCNGISIGFFDGMTVFWCYLTRYCFLLIDFIIYHLLIWFISSEAKRLILILVSFVFVIPILFFFWVYTWYFTKIELLFDMCNLYQKSVLWLSLLLPFQFLYWRGSYIDYRIWNED